MWFCFNCKFIFIILCVRFVLKPWHFPILFHHKCRVTDQFQTTLCTIFTIFLHKWRPLPRGCSTFPWAGNLVQHSIDRFQILLLLPSLFDVILCHLHLDLVCCWCYLYPACFVCLCYQPLEDEYLRFLWKMMNVWMLSCICYFFFLLFN